jgi:hypothetical protein
MDDDLDPRGAAEALRIQQYGRRRPNDIEDALVEPLWTGVRVLAAIGAEATLFHDGREIVARPDLLAALVDARRSRALVAEGHLTAEAFATGEGARLEQEHEQRRPLRMIAGALVPGGGRRDRFLKEREESAQELARVAAALDAAAAGERLAFVATDLLWLDGEELLEVPLLERKRLLESALAESDLVRRTAFVRPSATSSLVAWRSLGFTMLALKGANSRYRPGHPNDAWTTVNAPSSIASTPFR